MMSASTGGSSRCQYTRGTSSADLTGFSCAVAVRRVMASPLVPACPRIGFQWAPGPDAHCECARTSRGRNVDSYTRQQSTSCRVSVPQVVRTADMTYGPSQREQPCSAEWQRLCRCRAQRSASPETYAKGTAANNADVDAKKFAKRRRPDG